MTVAIIHYHLDRGGVTRVIINHLRALDAVASEPERVLVLAGPAEEGWPDDLAGSLEYLDVTRVVVPELAYDRVSLGETSRDCSRALADALAGHLVSGGARPESTVLHVHNHSLGKNVSLPGALVVLAEAGWPLLLQLHDFVEDLRPGNFGRLRQTLGVDGLERLLYPNADHVHYAVLNRRDLDRLRDLPDGPPVHFLPNPVIDPTAGEAVEGDQTELRRRVCAALELPEAARLLLYPVRAIRRKNLGEALLWAAAGEGAVAVAVTLEPGGADERQAYQRWVTLAETLELPCRFAAGQRPGLAFAELLKAADAVMTTSVAEGFGMTFLESWLVGRPLCGRDLPGVTADFRDVGVTFEHLYAKLLVPADWVDLDAWETSVCRALAGVLEDYGRELPAEGELQAVVEARIEPARRTIDFADLDVDRQADVIRRVAGSAAAVETLRRLNPVLAAVIDGDLAGDGVVAENAAVIRRHYAAGPSGRRLRAVYDEVLACRRDGSVGSVGLPFLDRRWVIESFQPIRV